MEDPVGLFRVDAGGPCDKLGEMAGIVERGAPLVLGELIQHDHVRSLLARLGAVDAKSAQRLIRVAGPCKERIGEQLGLRGRNTQHPEERRGKHREDDFHARLLISVC